MADVFLTRIRLRPGASREEAFWRMIGKGDAHHKLVWRFFSKEEQGRDFLYRTEGTDEKTTFFTLSRRPPRDDTGLWIIDEPKPFSPRLTRGQKLEFVLRANPVRRSANIQHASVRERIERRASKHHNSSDQKHDVVMLEKHRLSAACLPIPDEPELVQLQGARWLEQKEIGARWLRIVADGYQQHRVFRPRASATFSTIEFSGLLEVTDPALMIEKLWAGAAPGLGSARGFGCGLMLVRRPSPSWMKHDEDDDEDEG